MKSFLAGYMILGSITYIGFLRASDEMIKKKEIKMTPLEAVEFSYITSTIYGIVGGIYCYTITQMLK